MQRILRDINRQELSMALKGAPEKLREHIYGNMSERARDTLIEEIEILGPQLAKDVYSMQRKIVELVRSLEEEGEIVISTGAGFEVIQ